ncbi:unnamed protein product [Brassicogethes aeneus]|uniref:Malate dehydrogenase, mitochondrial n=1 Tax=Brassicogethes aeneus TaxID=1431903 RepID=A0A9P0BCH4_BRAAE|nr:unnamed protein product [Brassicogethes aeneus]
MFSSKLSVVNKILPFVLRKCCTFTHKQVFTTHPVVTVLNACSNIGRNISLLLKQSPHIHELKLYDVNKEVFNIAEDLSHIDTRTQVKSFKGNHVIRQAIEDADIIIHAGGCQRKPGETSAKLFEQNVDSVRAAALYAAEFNPKGIFCIQTPPVESLVPMVSEEYKKAGVYDARKIIGITSISSMRANHFIAKYIGGSVSDILTPIVGGHGPLSTVAVFSQVRPQANIPQSTTQLIQRNICEAEDDILKLFKDPSSCISLSTAVGVARFVNNLTKAILGETNCVDCAFVRQMGHIANFLPYMTSIIRLGRHGVLSTHMPKINDQEAYRLKKASIFIRTNIHLGENFISGSSLKNEEVAKPTENIESVKQ